MTYKTNDQHERELFEAWVRKDYPSHNLELLGTKYTDTTISYKSAGTQHKFLGFKTGRASNEIEDAALRELLAFICCGPLLYNDDGELQDTTKIPFIDFKRDSVATIKDKMHQRVLRYAPPGIFS